MRINLLLIIAFFISPLKVYTQDNTLATEFQKLLDDPDNVSTETTEKKEVIVEPVPKPLPVPESIPVVEPKPVITPVIEKIPEKTPEVKLEEPKNEQTKPESAGYKLEFNCYKALKIYGANNLLDAGLILIADQEDKKIFYVFATDECIKYKLPKVSTYSDSATDTYHIKLERPASVKLSYKVTGNISARYEEDFPIIHPVKLEELPLDNPKQILHDELKGYLISIFSKYQEAKKSSSSIINKKNSFNTLNTCSKISELKNIVKREKSKF